MTIIPARKPVSEFFISQSPLSIEFLPCRSYLRSKPSAADCEKGTRRDDRSAHIERRRITLPQSPDEVESLATGRGIARITRRGKNILIGLGRPHSACPLADDGRSVRDPGCEISHGVHLRLVRIGRRTGTRVQRPARSSPVMQTLRLLDASELARLLRKSGGPLARGFTAEDVHRIRRPGSPAGQIVPHGPTACRRLGKYHTAGALFAARIDPRVPMTPSAAGVCVSCATRLSGFFAMR